MDPQLRSIASAVVPALISWVGQKLIDRGTPIRVVQLLQSKAAAAHFTSRWDTFLSELVNDAPFLAASYIKPEDLQPIREGLKGFDIRGLDISSNEAFLSTIPQAFRNLKGDPSTVVPLLLKYTAPAVDGIPLSARIALANWLLPSKTVEATVEVRDE